MIQIAIFNNIILCVIEIVTHRLEYFTAIIEGICADAAGKENGWY